MLICDVTGTAQIKFYVSICLIRFYNNLCGRYLHYATTHYLLHSEGNKNSQRLLYSTRSAGLELVAVK